MKTVCMCLSVGFAKCNERRRDNRQARPAFAPPTQLVHPSHMRYQRRWSLWRPRLVVKPAKESEVDQLRELVSPQLIGNIVPQGLKLVSLITVLLSRHIECCLYILVVTFGSLCLYVCVLLCACDNRSSDKKSAIVIVYLYLNGYAV